MSISSNISHQRQRTYASISSPPSHWLHHPSFLHRYARRQKHHPLLFNLEKYRSIVNVTNYLLNDVAFLSILVSNDERTNTPAKRIISLHRDFGRLLSSSYWIGHSQRQKYHPPLQSWVDRAITTISHCYTCIYHQHKSISLLSRAGTAWFDYIQSSDLCPLFSTLADSEVPSEVQQINGHNASPSKSPSISQSTRKNQVHPVPSLHATKGVLCLNEQDPFRQSSQYSTIICSRVASLSKTSHGSPKPALCIVFQSSFIMSW